MIFSFPANSLREHYWRQAEILQCKRNLPYEMMPILYALVKSLNGDINAAHDNIDEGKKRLIIMNSRKSPNARRDSVSVDEDNISNHSLSENEHRNNFEFDRPPREISKKSAHENSFDNDEIKRSSPHRGDYSETRKSDAQVFYLHPREIRKRIAQESLENDRLSPPRKHISDTKNSDTQVRHDEITDQNRLDQSNQRSELQNGIRTKFNFNVDSLINSNSINPPHIANFPFMHPRSYFSLLSSNILNPYISPDIREWLMHINAPYPPIHKISYNNT